MAIQLDGTLVSTTMRTPGNDYELAVGFCHAEGLLAGAAVTGVRYCADGSAVDSEFNVVTVETGGRAPTPTPRLGMTSSSCGLCGSTALNELTERLSPLPADRLAAIPLSVLVSVPDRVLGGQGLFTSTGAVHAAAAFGADGEPLIVREDVGRHNAVDKVVGRLLLDAPAAGARHGVVRIRAGELRDGAEGVGSRVRVGRRGQRADGARRGHGPHRRDHARRVRPR